MRRPRLPLEAFLRERARAVAASSSRRLQDLAGRLLSALWPPRAAHAALLLAAGVAALGLVGLLLPGRLARRLPTELDWRAAAAVLARDARPGDAVAVAPRWAERARISLPAGLPVLSLADPATDPLLGVRRMWVLALGELPGAEPERRRLEAALAERAAGRTPAVQVGALALSRFDLRAPALPVAFLPDLPLRFEGAGASAAREVREVAGGPRPCLAVRAAPGAPASVVVGPVPAGGRLRGRAVLLAGGKAHLTVSARGQEADLELRTRGAPGARSRAGAGASPGRPLGVGALPEDGPEVPFELAGTGAPEATFEVRLALAPGDAAAEACVDAWVVP